MTVNKILLVQKLKALAAHLSISVVLVGVALGLMLTCWFPGPLFATDGGGVGLKLLLLVDLVLGPLLTFVVFNPSKVRHQMVLDLGVIAVLQLAAYGYGLFNIHSVRVQAVAFYEGQFYSVTADRFSDQQISSDDWRPLGSRAPYLVHVREPRTGDEASGVLAFGMTAGLEPYQLQFLYAPLAESASAVWQAGSTLAELGESKVKAMRWLAERQQSAKSVRFLRMEGFYQIAILVFDEQGHWLGGFAGDLPKKTVKPSSPSPKS